VPLSLVYETDFNDFYFGVLRPVACTLSRSLEDPSLTTTLQGVYFIFYLFLPLHVSALVGPLQAEYNYFKKLLRLQRIRCFVLLGPIFICSLNSAVVCLMWVSELSRRGQIASLLSINLKMLRY
jgi:hypothetical protein